MKSDVYMLMNNVVIFTAINLDTDAHCYIVNSNSIKMQKSKNNT